MVREPAVAQARVAQRRAGVSVRVGPQWVHRHTELFRAVMRQALKELMEDLTGRQFGAYQIMKPLGEGGMAAVYQAYHPAMERYVALKILPRHLATDQQFVLRFQREAKLLAQLQHPHILPVFDFGKAEGYSYLVMPFIPSGTLRDLLQGQPLAWPRIRKVVEQIGDALDYAHESGLIHRDVKPSNVLLDERGNCLLSDFGLARIVEAATHLTTTGNIMGTPAYMSPEQGSGKSSDHRSDIYSLGVILYELITGRVPYKAETPIGVIFKHIQDPLPPARDLNPELPEAVERVLLKALAKNPEDRYQRANEMVQAIQSAIADDGPQKDGTAIAPITAGESSNPVASRASQAEFGATIMAPPPRPSWGIHRWFSLGALGLGVVLAIGLLIANPDNGLPPMSARVSTTTPTVQSVVSTPKASPSVTKAPPATPTASRTPEPTTTPVTQVSATPTPSKTVTALPARVLLPPCEEILIKTRLWSGGVQVSCDTTNKKAGQASLRMFTPDFGIVEVYSALIAVQPNTEYVVSYWVKTDIEFSGDGMYGKVIVAQYNSDAQEADAVEVNRIDAGFKLGDSVGGKIDWVARSYSFATSPDTAFVRLRAPLGGPVNPARGTMWLDQVSIRQR